MQTQPSVGLNSTPFSPFHDSWANSWKAKLSVIIVGIVVIVLLLALLVSSGVLKKLFSQPNQGLTDEQKIQILKNLSGSSSLPQPSDQQKLQTLQNLSQPQPGVMQSSDADKLKTLQQVNSE